MRHLAPRSQDNSRGFTLVELMIGMLIGLLVTVVIAQVLVGAEGRRRTTAAGSNAQVDGALALYTLQRDVQMAGYGLTSHTDGVGCAIRAQRGGVDSNFVMAPVVIVNGAAGAPDTLLVMSSAKQTFSLPTRIIDNSLPASTDFSVSSTLGIEVGDLMVAVPPTIDTNNWCSIFQVTSTGPGPNLLTHATGTNGAWNQAGNVIFPADGYPINSYVINIGQFVTRTYGVSADQVLQLTSWNSAAALTSTDDLFPNIVNLQAFYGKDTDTNGVVDTYDTVTPTTAAGWRQVLVVRLAVVARSAQMEKDAVTAAQPLWDVGTAASVAGSATCGASRCVTLTVNGLADWQRYRYKVYDSVIPLRNMKWNS